MATNTGLFYCTELIREYAYSLWASLHYWQYQMPPPAWNQGDTGTIVFVSGVMGTWITARPLLDHCNQLGYRILVVSSLEFGLETLDRSADHLERFITEKQLENVILIGHSKGGLIIKYFMDKSDYAKWVKKAICIASPFRGTIWGNLQLFNLGEIACNSRYVHQLDRSVIANQHITSIYPLFDNAVLPRGSSVLEGATNFELKRVGHAHLLATPECIETVSRVLATN